MKQLMYAAPFTGKSHFAARAVRELGGIVLDTDDNWHELGVPYATDEELAKGDVSLLKGKVVYVPVEKIDRAIKICNLLRDEHIKGNTVTPLLVWDGHTEYQRKQGLLFAEKRASESKTGNVSDMSLDQKGWDYLLRSHVKLNAQMNPSVTGANLYATARMREAYNPIDSAMNEYRPKLDGSMKDDIEAYYSIVTPMFKFSKGKRITRRVYFHPDEHPDTMVSFAVGVRGEDSTLKGVFPAYTDSIVEYTDDGLKVIEPGLDLLDMLIMTGEIDAPKKKKEEAA